MEEWGRELYGRLIKTHIYRMVSSSCLSTCAGVGWLVISLRNEGPKRGILPARPVEGDAVAGSEGTERSVFCLVLHLFVFCWRRLAERLFCVCPVPGTLGATASPGPHRAHSPLRETDINKILS